MLSRAKFPLLLPITSVLWFRFMLCHTSSQFILKERKLLSLMPVGMLIWQAGQMYPPVSPVVASKYKTIHLLRFLRQMMSA